MTTRIREILLPFVLLASVGVVSLGQTQQPAIGGPTSIFTTYDEAVLRKGEYKFTVPVVLEEKLSSSLMGRPMAYRVILPIGYDGEADKNKRYPVVYLLHGLMGHYNNWTDKTRVAAVSSSLGMITVTPEGEDGWYTDSASKASDKYESYIIQELIPEIDKKFRTIPNRPNRAIAGLSMGGFGAVKFGLKYPELFSLAGSFSGAIGGATITEKEFPGAIGRTINSIFGPVGSPTRASNDPFSIIRTATPDKISKLPFIYLDCGTEDFLFRNNRDFVALLVDKKVPHEYRQLPGEHNWTYWDRQVEEFLDLAARRFPAAQNAAKAR